MEEFKRAEYQVLTEGTPLRSNLIHTAEAERPRNCQLKPRRRVNIWAHGDWRKTCMRTLQSPANFLHPERMFWKFSLSLSFSFLFLSFTSISDGSTNKLVFNLPCLTGRQTPESPLLDQIILFPVITTTVFPANILKVNWLAHRPGHAHRTLNHLVLNIHQTPNKSF